MKKQKKVLIIDDDEVFLKVLEDGLKSSGKYKVVSAHDGEEGLKRAIEEKPDAIFVDLMMPKMDGMEFVRKARENKDFLLTPIFMLTQVSSPEKMAEGALLGIRGYIVKSDFSIDGLIDMVDNATENTH